MKLNLNDPEFIKSHINPSVFLIYIYILSQQYIFLNSFI